MVQRIVLGAASGTGLALATLVSYELTTRILTNAISSRDDQMLGGMCSVVATLFVCRQSYNESVSAALSRTAATSLSFILYLGYLLLFPFSSWGMTILIAIGAVILVMIDRQGDVITTSITTAVASVFGAVGRSNSATDNAPLDMYDTTVMLKPREQWPAGMTYEKLIQQTDEKLQFPGLSNTWTMPVENRLDMELTGIKTPPDLKEQGPNVDGVQQLTSQIQNVLSGLPEMRSIFAEKVAQGLYVNVDVNRSEAACYGLTVADVQAAVESGIGGQNIAENIEDRERYPINVRYQRDFRDNVEKMRGVLIGTQSGAQIPLGQVARISFSHAPAMIRDKDGALTGYIYIDLKNKAYGGFVRKANKLLHD